MGGRQMFVTVGVVLAVGAAAAAATNSAAVEGGTPTFTIANNRFILDGEHHRLISGSMHYFRIHPSRQDYGLSTQPVRQTVETFNSLNQRKLQVYTPWNFHEPYPGHFDWEGVADIERWIALIKEVGLKVLLRPGPCECHCLALVDFLFWWYIVGLVMYAADICAEWENGGFPSWFASSKVSGGRTMRMRTHDPLYLEHVDRWWATLFAKLRRHMHENGGPILMVQVENELGFCNDDKAYLRHLAALVRMHLSRRTLLFTTDPPGVAARGTLAGEEVYTVVDFGPGYDLDTAFGVQKSLNAAGKSPPFCSEFYTGWLSHWGEKMANTSTELLLHDTQALLEYANSSASLSFYMLHGGTNFGFWAGANVDGTRYLPHITSYDYDSPISESGDYCQPGIGGPCKYHALREVIQRHTGAALPEVPPRPMVADYGRVELRDALPLLDAVKQLFGEQGGVRTQLPDIMEEYGQRWGLILYRTQLPATALSQGATLDLGAPVHDYASVLVDGHMVGRLDRSEPSNVTMVLPVQAAGRSSGPGATVQLDIIVENFGCDTGNWDFKGLTSRNVTLNGKVLRGWEVYPLEQLDDPSGLSYASGAAGEVMLAAVRRRMLLAPTVGVPRRDAAAGPIFFRGSFSIDGATAMRNAGGQLADTNLAVQGWSKGIAWCNGFALGWYWPRIGPQMTLYIPGPVLREGLNEIVLLEVERPADDEAVWQLVRPPFSDGTASVDVSLPVRSSADEKPSADNADGLPLPKIPKQQRRRRAKPTKPDEPFSIAIDDLNPVTMGRKSREVFDDVWTQLQRIGNPARSNQASDGLTSFVGAGEFESPDAASTTVLVTGATGRVGRVLVRKLLLRGYKVRALVRQRDSSGAASGGADSATEAIPQSAELVFGDVGDYKACRRAVEGVDKVICCSGARSTITADLSRVEEQGVSNLAAAFMDAQNSCARREGRLASVAKREVVDFKHERYHDAWDIRTVGKPVEEVNASEKAGKGRRRAAERARARDVAECYINEDDNLVFEGAVYSRGGMAEVGAQLQLPPSQTLHGCEGVVLRTRADEHAYTCVLRTSSGGQYGAKFNTRPGYNTIRLPFNAFRPASTDGVPLQPGNIAMLEARWAGAMSCHQAMFLCKGDIEYVGIRFEPRMKLLEEVTQPGQSMFDQSTNRFKLEVDWIKALPGGAETNFVLVSCAGTHRPDLEESQREKVVAYKRKGETALRNSGLGYTIVRPGPLVEEAGGYKALVFDQGNRISQGISCADVADVCLKALHNPEARNKTFEVCFEYQPEEGLEFYELISHLPDKSNSYLTPALAVMHCAMSASLRLTANAHAAAPRRASTVTVRAAAAPVTATKLNTKRSEQIFKEAQDLLPGGVNSPVRAFKSVGGQPIVFDHVKGAYCWDADENKYIDYVGSWGPAIVGHANDEVNEALKAQIEKGTSFGAPCALENVLAKMVIERVPSVEMVRFVNSGTEACLSVVRLMRAYTGREKLIKFTGCYHGHADQFLVQAGSGVLTLGLSDSPGVPATTAAATLTAKYNDLESVKALFEANKGEIAGLILEPVVGNSGFIPPTKEFLQGLRDLCTQEGAVLVFDEVMTGFRIAKGCAQEHFGVTPDLTTMGKVIGGGLPVGAYGGKREIMQMVAPSGPMYQAGTLSGNPLAMVAGIKTLEILARPGAYEHLDKVTSRLIKGILDAGKEAGHAMCGSSISGMFGFFFCEGPVSSFEDAKDADTVKFGKFHRGMLEHGVYLAPSQFEAGFTSLAHTEADIDATIEAARSVLKSLERGSTGKRYERSLQIASRLRVSEHTGSPHAARVQASSALPHLAREFLAAASSPMPGLAVGAAVNTLVYAAGIRVLLSGLTWEGVASSWMLGTLAYSAFGPGAYLIVCVYFLVTKVKLKQKQQEGIAEARSGRRSVGSVLGSGAAGIVCAVAALCLGDPFPWRMGFAASFASKLADTTSSEIGKAYGRTTYLITTLQRVPRGTEGAVSLEGTAAGAAAAAGLGGIAYALGQADIYGVAAITAAAFLANLFESWLGATVQGRLAWLSNDIVNVVQIVVAAALAMTFVV
ncbi:Glutamate-1-semialdehyde 2 [Chlorella vulgaris]